MSLARCSLLRQQLRLARYAPRHVISSEALESPETKLLFVETYWLAAVGWEMGYVTGKRLMVFVDGI